MTQTNNKWFNQNEVISKLALAIDIPKHRVYVDVLGNGGAFLVQKLKAKVEVFNDVDNELLTFLLAARSNPQMLSQDALLRLRNTMIENVEVDRLFGIYDGPETLFYVDLVHQELAVEYQLAILKQVTTLEANVLLLLPSEMNLPDWYHVDLVKGVHVVTNFSSEQMSLFMVQPSMEGVMNHE